MGAYPAIHLIGGALHHAVNKDEAKMEEYKNLEEIWYLILHSYEVNTFQNVQCALCEVVRNFD